MAMTHRRPTDVAHGRPALRSGTRQRHPGRFFNTTPLWIGALGVLGHPLFQTGLRTTLILSTVAARHAYMLRTRWPILDSIIWLPRIPGIIASLGRSSCSSTPGLAWLTARSGRSSSSISGNTTGTLFKGVMVQLGKDMEEAARVSGALRTAKVVIPVLAMILIGTLRAGGSEHHPARVEGDALSILALQWGSDEPPRTVASSSWCSRSGWRWSRGTS